MKLRRAMFSLFATLCLAATAALPGAAQTLYENGPINGNIDAWTINFGFSPSDTFTISSGPSTVNGLEFGAWLSTGDILETVQVTLSSEAFGTGTVYFNQDVGLTSSNCSGNDFGFNVCTETASFNGPLLNNGTYWLTLQNAVVNTGDPVYWDENYGVGCHSQGCPSQAVESSLGSIGSEAFTLLGSAPTSSTGTTPEPSSLVLFGSGFLGVVAMLRRKML